MIAYSQNAEDVILDRAFRGVEQGFYVDVGAASPNEATVTRHFYEAGWSGLNLEPLPEWAAELRQVRIRDVNLEVACGAADGLVTLYRVREDPALSTLELNIAEGHRRSGYHVDELNIVVRTLNSILDEHAPAVIDFLKIDVEGAEYEVLRGLDLDRWRPRVIVIESTLPTTLVPNHEEFEPYLTNGRYVFAATDGINRYYARAEEADYLVPLLVPANSTDDYVFLREHLLAEEIVRLRTYVSHLEHDLETSVAFRAEPAEASKAHVEPVVSKAPRKVFSSIISIDRIAVCTSPLTGGTKLAAMLGKALGTTSVLAEHPADIRFDELPDSCVVELPWARGEKLRATLASNGFQVVTVLRHPLDTLLSYLRLAQVDSSTARFLDGDAEDDRLLLGASPADDRFAAWAIGPRANALLEVSSSWSSDPSVLTVDYQLLVASASTVVEKLLTLGRFETKAAIDQLPEMDGPDLEYLGSGWEALLPAAALDKLREVLQPLTAKLGFDELLVSDDPPTLLESTESWQALFRR